MSYTKGEWKIEFWDDTKRELDLPSRDVRIYSSLHKSYWIADCGLRTDPERVANARLIAAAPKLLEACILALDRLGRIYPEHAVVCKLPVDECPTKKAIDKLKAAIAEAEKGE